MQSKDSICNGHSFHKSIKGKHFVIFFSPAFYYNLSERRPENDGNNNNVGMAIGHGGWLFRELYLFCWQVEEPTI